MNKEQKKRFNAFCKKEKLKTWQREGLRLIMEIIIKKKIKVATPTTKIANYILNGNK